MDTHSLQNIIRNALNGLSKLWFYTMLNENPHLFDGNDLTIVGKAIEG
jgi:hypothetical protein